MWPAFPASDYYGGSALPQGTGLTVRQSRFGLDGRATGPPHGSSHGHCRPFNGMGAQLFPGGLATTTPQHFTVASGC